MNWLLTIVTVSIQLGCNVALCISYLCACIANTHMCVYKETCICAHITPVFLDVFVVQNYQHTNLHACSKIACAFLWSTHAWHMSITFKLQLLCTIYVEHRICQFDKNQLSSFGGTRSKNVTRSEKSWLPRTQQQDTLFTIKRQLYTLTNNSARY